MNIKLQLRELAARSQRVVELARGDYAIQALGLPMGRSNFQKFYPFLSQRKIVDVLRNKNHPAYLASGPGSNPVVPAEYNRNYWAYKLRARKEFARGDYAIPAMKRLLKKGVGNGGDPISIAEIGVSGATVPSLRGNATNVRRALNKFWESPHSMAEAEGLMRGNRKWAAQTIREARKR
jgi:hypothetical protein